MRPGPEGWGREGCTVEGLGKATMGRELMVPTTDHDAYPVRNRVPGYYESCSERFRVCHLKKYRQLKQFLHIDWILT